MEQGSRKPKIDRRLVATQKIPFRKKFYQLAKQASEQKQVSLAWELLRYAAWLDPDHAKSRAILGYERYENQWLRPSTIKKLKQGLVNHEKFGWLPQDYAKRYENGSRYWQNGWISQDRDSHLHFEYQYWLAARSEHFTLTTNHSLEEGAKLSRQLENLFDVWQHVFVACTITPEELQTRFTAAEKQSADTSEPDKRMLLNLKPLPLDVKKFKVVLFADRDQYNAALKPAQASIDKTMGIYFATAKTAYFFAGEDQDPGTILHEATHQLFQESESAGKDVGSKSNFWLIEAVACYMETLEPVEEKRGFYSVASIKYA